MDTVTDFVNKTKGTVVDKFFVAGPSKVGYSNSSGPFSVRQITAQC